VKSKTEVLILDEIHWEERTMNDEGAAPLLYVLARNNIYTELLKAAP